MAEGDRCPIDDMLDANRGYVASHVFQTPSPRPAKGIAVVLCMDARIDPFSALGFERGDAHIIRNAGGRLAEAERSLVVSQRLLGTEAVAIIHHTECGLMRPSDAEVREAIGLDVEEADEMAFLTFRSLEESLREDLEAYRAPPLLRQDIPVRAFVYEVETGLLREVE
jgi:carbonic anhydrase